MPATDTTEAARVSLSGHVLVVDDGLDNRRLISYLLEKAGATVTLAEDGRKALKLMIESQQDTTDQPRFDLVLMDMQMPEMDGYTATRKSREAGYQGTIVALTANAMQGDRDKCLDAGCDNYTSKPIVRGTFLKLVARYLSGDAAGFLATRRRWTGKTLNQRYNPDSNLVHLVRGRT